MPGKAQARHKFFLCALGVNAAPAQRQRSIGQCGNGMPKAGWYLETRAGYRWHLFSRFDVAVVAVSAGIATQVATLRNSSCGRGMLPSWHPLEGTFLTDVGRMCSVADSAALHILHGIFLSPALMLISHASVWLSLTVRKCDGYEARSHLLSEVASLSSVHDFVHDCMYETNVSKDCVGRRAMTSTHDPSSTRYVLAHPKSALVRPWE